MNSELPTIYSAFSIPSVTSRPSPSCLQWSADGRAFFISKGSVYILTPERGLHSVTLPPGDDQNSHVRWFSTMIDFSARDVHAWALASQAWGALSAGSLDVGLRAVACSPSNLTANKTCVAAILSTNMDLSLWHTINNTVNGEWVKLCEVTPLLVELAFKEESSLDERTLSAQVVCMVWSSHADFNVTPAPCLDSALLVTGMRAGLLMFFRFANTALEHVATVKVSEEWITHLAFSAWKPCESGESSISLAYGTPHGAVGLVNITQTLCPVSTSSAFTLDYVIETRIKKSELAIFEATNSGITALSCILPRGNTVWVRTTPGVVSLRTGEASALSWSGYRSIRLSTQKLSVGSSSFQPVSGLHYAHYDDALLVTLFDGSIHVIETVTQEPKLADVSKQSGDLTSEGLSHLLHSTFGRTECAKNVSKLDVSRVAGMIPFDGSSTLLWAQESAQPANFDYKYDVLHENTLLLNCESQARTMRSSVSSGRFYIQAKQPNALAQLIASGETPLHILRPIFLRSQDLLELRPAVIDVLVANADKCPPAPEIPSWSGGVSDTELRAGLRRSLRKHLFGCDVLLSLRLRLSVADFCWRNSTDDEQRIEYSRVAHGLLQIISAITMQILCRHLAATVECLQDADIPFVLRIAKQATVEGAPARLRADGSALFQALVSKFSETQTHELERSAMEESCPACGLAIFLDDGCAAVCMDGHTWSRCAATTFILATPKVRTCTGCARKVFLPPSAGCPDVDSGSGSSGTSGSWLPPPAQSWVVEEFLEAASRCLFCGNNFCSMF